MDNLEGMLFIAADGDGIGKMVGRAVIANDVEGLHKISQRIDAAQDFILHWAKLHDGKKVSGGGDEFTAAVPEKAIGHLEGLRKDVASAFGYTISIGVGKNLHEAGTALLVAKLRGKDRVVEYSKEIESDIKKAKRRVREKRATPDEYKLSEAYLKKGENMETNEANCPYCQQTDGVDPNHCKYCHDQEQVAGTDGCPYCQQAQGHAADDCPYCQQNPGHSDNHQDDCPYCQQSEAPQQGTPYDEKVPGAPEQREMEQNRIGSPDSTNQEATPGSPQEKEMYNRMDMNPPAHGKPQVGDNSPQGEGQANPGDAGAPLAAEGQAPSAIAEEGAHSKESLQAIAQEIEGQTVDGKPDMAQEANQVDDVNVHGQDMEHNVSRPAGFDSNTPGDMGMPDGAPEDTPNISQVLQDGLDDHANQQQRERVVQMVSHALQGFKASKAVLENAKMQSPQLYAASIAMLQAMIEMAKMLGFGGSQPTESAGPVGAMEGVTSEGAGAGAPHDEWQDPFPTHPDQGGQMKPGHAPPSGGGEGGIGQGIGKLPTKATTEHVARTPMAPGGVNTQGQQKVIDPKTGKTRWIDRKQGMVQSSTGVPVKPPKRGNDEPQA